MVAYRNSNGMTLTGAGEPEKVRSEMVSAGFFELMGVTLVAGRTFTADEDRLGAAPVVMISEGLWKRKFASNPYVVGQVITLDGQPRTIIGIVPASFRFDSGTSIRPRLTPPSANITSLSSAIVPRPGERTPLRV